MHVNSGFILIQENVIVDTAMQWTQDYNMYALIGAHFTPMAVGPQPMPPAAAAGLQAGAPVGAQGGAQAVAATGAGQAQA